MSSKRHSVLPAVDRSLPRPPVNFSPSITISDKAILVGYHSITIQADTCIHPRARLDSTKDSISLGRRCIIHEKTNIGEAPEPSEDTEGKKAAEKREIVLLGDYVLVESGSVIEAGGTEVGEGTTVRVGCRIGSGAKIGKYCDITPMSVVRAGEIVPDYTVVFSHGKRRTFARKGNEIRNKAITSEIAVLRKLIENNPERFK